MKVLRVSVVTAGGGPPCSICHRNTIDRGDRLERATPLAVVVIELEASGPFVCCKDCEPIARLGGMFRNALNRAAEVAFGTDDGPLEWRP